MAPTTYFDSKHADKTAKLEARAKAFLTNTSAGNVQVEIANIDNVGQTDLAVHTEDGRKIWVDVQKSENFACYHDLRLDVVSAASACPNYTLGDLDTLWRHNRECENFTQAMHRTVTVHKWGKILADEQMATYCDYVLYLVYDRYETAEPPTHVCLLDVSKTRTWLGQHWTDHPMFFNNKAANGIVEKHLSAFVAAPATTLTRSGLISRKFLPQQVAAF